ncbi:MAG: hypothetical protein RPR40_13435 [Bermanella sp.]
MNITLSIILMLLCASVQGAGLDLRKVQSPVLDAEASANSVRPKFAAFIVEHQDKPRMPGVNSEQRRIIQKKYGVKVLNEYRLYQVADKKMSKQDQQENYTLERYCTRYNRHLLTLLGL